MKFTMNNKLLTLIKSIIAMVLLLYLFSKVDWNTFFVSLKKINIWYVIVPALMAYISIFISVLKWDVFLKNYGIVINKLKLYSFYSIGTFVNNFLPTTIGGDAYRIIYLNKKFPDKKKEIVSSVILERGLGFLSLFLVNFLLAPFYYKSIISNKNFLFLELFILLFFIVILFFVFQYRILIKIKNKLIKKEIPIINKFHNFMVFLFNIKDKKIILYGLGYSFIFSLLIACARYILFFAFKLEINFWYILLVSAITQIIGLIPISLNSIGITEGLTVFLFSIVGIPLEIALAVALIGRVSLIVTSSFGGLFYFFDSKIKINS